MRVAAVVLAAGGSSRMGQPKQLLPFRGQSLLRHTITTALAADCDPVVVVLGAHLEQLMPEVADLRTTVIVNNRWADGPGTSVRAGIAALPDSVDAVAMLLCDQPYVTVERIQQLVEACDGIAAAAYSGTLGVPAVFLRSYFPALLALTPAVGAKQVLVRDAARVRSVPVPEAAYDIDTPDDYERLQGEQYGK